MLVRLNVATRVHHPEADAPWLDLMAREPTRSRYIDLLVATYGFEQVAEAIAKAGESGGKVLFTPRT